MLMMKNFEEFVLFTQLKYSKIDGYSNIFKY